VEARATMSCTMELVLGPGAPHLFAEPGALEQVAAHASRWFVTHLVPSG
jgi:putative phosphoribosyl transferase